MQSETHNPYQTPATDPARAIRGVLDDALQTRSRAEFETEITEQDLIDAMRDSSLRRDLARLRRIRWLFLIPALLLVFGQGARWMGTGSVTSSSVYIVLGGIALVAYVSLLHRWIVSKHVQNNRDQLGPVKGWIDRQSLWIETQNQIRYRLLSQLTGTDVSRRQWVLCFDATHTLFETLPVRGFEDPDTAQILAENLGSVRPFSKMTPFDARRLAAPTDPPQFAPHDGAIFYAGELNTVDIEGTPLARAQRRARLSVLGRLLLTVAIMTGIIFAFGFSVVMTLLVLLIITLVFVLALYRILRVPLAGQADPRVLYRSAGWIDHAGMVSMTAVGQTMSKWSAFDHAVIAERVILARTNSGSLWHMIARSQFTQESDWEAACRLVRQQLPAEGRPEN